MNVSTRGIYGLKFFLDLGLYNSTGWVPLRDAAERQGISQKYLWHLANALKTAGLIRVLRGPRGGFTLARSPESITLKDVLAALEGDCSLVKGAAALKQDATAKGCVTNEVWAELERKMQEAMESISLEQMLHRQKLKQGELATDWMI